MIQQACSESPAMCGPSLSLNQSSAHPQYFEEGNPSRRVEVAPGVGSDDLDSLQGSGGGSICHELENAHCLLFFSLSHSPLKGDALTSHWPAARLYIYVKTKKKITTKRGFGDTHRPELAKPALVPGPDRAAGGIALADPCQEGSAISDERLGVAPEPGVVEPSCVVASGISEQRLVGTRWW